ncbi:MAG: universal stress protein [Bacteroidia bacterium]|nr:universal stress protein [Bacteroidia bacterium]
MKTTIICPIDFSDSANNASEYAAMLAQVINAELMLFNVQQIHFETAVSLGEGVGSRQRESSLWASNKLKQMSLDINKLYQIPTTYEVDITTKSLAKTIASAVTRNTMIVMGTNGPDNLKQFFGGTNTYKASTESECPLLIVPEDLSFEKYKNVLFPIIYGNIDRKALDQFYEFINFFDAQITFLYLTEENNTKTKKEFNQIKEEIETFLNSKLKHTVKTAFTDNIEDTLDDFILENQTDLLVMEERHRNTLQRFFQKKPILATLSAIAPYPILVVHP